MGSQLEDIMAGQPAQIGFHNELAGCGLLKKPWPAWLQSSNMYTLMTYSFYFSDANVDDNDIKHLHQPLHFAWLAAG